MRTALGCLLLLLSTFGTARAAEFVWTAPGVAPAPIIIPSGSPPRTLDAARTLAEYVEKTSGAKPAIVEGEPQPMPDRAVWVGYQPVLKELFPQTDFEFRHPEETLLAANDKHLVIAGRDRWDPARLDVEGGDGPIRGK